MSHTHRKAGFSLMEVNMAVFVMAVGILSLVALFPLGLRESVQGKQDLQQSMFADYALNQLVATLSQTNLYWSEWRTIGDPDGTGTGTAYPDSVAQPGKPTRNKTQLPSRVGCNIQNQLDLPGKWTVSGKEMKDKDYRIFFNLVEGASDRVMGIAVRSTDVDVSRYELYTNNVLYYAEALFQGDPSK